MAVDVPVKLTNGTTDGSGSEETKVKPKDVSISEPVFNGSGSPIEALPQRSPARKNNRRQSGGRPRRQSEKTPRQEDGRQRQQSTGGQRQEDGRQRQQSTGGQRQGGEGRQRQTSVTITERVVIIKRTDMSEEMQKEAIKLALDGLKRFTVERNAAAFIKKEFDQKYGSTWHCIVGKSFGSFVTHESKHFAFFYVDEDAVLLYKTSN